MTRIADTAWPNEKKSKKAQINAFDGRNSISFAVKATLPSMRRRRDGELGVKLAGISGANAWTPGGCVATASRAR